MSLSPIQLETRIQELVEGILDEGQWPEFRDELIRSEEARAMYCAHVRMHSALDRRVKGLKAVLAHESLIPVEKLEQVRLRGTMRHASLAAAAALIIAALLMSVILLTPPPPAIAFEATAGSLFTLTHPEGDDPPDARELLVGSRLVLKQGVLDLSFGSGVRSIVRAPADFTLTAESRLQLDEGIAWFQVPRKAVGFQVTTPELEATDLGTEFGVISQPEEADEVHVFHGRVEVAARTGLKVRNILVASQARSAGVVGKLAVIPSDPGHFLNSLPRQMPYLHWSFDGADPGTWNAGGNLSPDGGSMLRTGAHQGLPAIKSAPGSFGRAVSSPDFDSFAASDRIGPDGRVPFTVAYWFRIEPGATHDLNIVLLGWGKRLVEPGAGKAFLTHLNRSASGSTVGATMGSVWWWGTTPVDDGAWHHHTVVYSGRHPDSGEPELRFYLDGRPEQVVRFNDPKTALDGRATDSAILDTAGPGAAPVTFFTPPEWPDQATPHDATLLLDEVFVIESALDPEDVTRLFRHNLFQTAPPTSD